MGFGFTNGWAILLWLLGAVALGAAAVAAIGLLLPFVMPTAILVGLGFLLRYVLQHSGNPAHPAKALALRALYAIRKRRVLASIGPGGRQRAANWFTVAENAATVGDTATARYAWSRIDELRS